MKQINYNFDQRGPTPMFNFCQVLAHLNSHCAGLVAQTKFTYKKMSGGKRDVGSGLGTALRKQIFYILFLIVHSLYKLKLI
jgi:hypothetical protein